MAVSPSQISSGSGIAKSASEKLSEFLAGLCFEALPPEVVGRAEEAFLDWFACSLAGRGARPIRILEQFSSTMGPDRGPCQILVSRAQTSAFFAALVNGAASHILEMDDLHGGAVLHPGTVVFPAVFAAAQHVRASGREFITAAVAGYEAVIRVGEFLGSSHYKHFHTTGTAGTLGAAAGVARVLKLDPKTMLHALGSAGTQAAGLWEFLREAADSKPLHSGKAAADGLLSAFLARDGFTGATRILEGLQGMGAGMSREADPARLADGLGTRWGILESSFKVHACCGHTHASADALLALIREQKLNADDIVHVTAHVHQGALDVLGGLTDPRTVHQSKFSMNFVLALIAVNRNAGLREFTEATLHDSRVRAFLDRVDMVFDEEINRAPGNSWGGWVEVKTRDGRILERRVNIPKGHPQDALGRSEIEAKAMMLASYAGGASPEEMRSMIARAWTLSSEPDLNRFSLAGR